MQHVCSLETKQWKIERRTRRSWTSCVGVGVWRCEGVRAQGTLYYHIHYGNIPTSFHSCRCFGVTVFHLQPLVTVTININTSWIFIALIRSLSLLHIHSKHIIKHKPVQFNRLVHPEMKIILVFTHPLLMSFQTRINFFLLWNVKIIFRISYILFFGRRKGQHVWKDIQ